MLISAAAFVIVIAGMREAQPLLVPFLLSIFIAIIVAPALSLMRDHRIPTVLAIGIIAMAIVAVGLLLGGLVGNSVDAFSAQLPVYQEKLHGLTASLRQWLTAKGLEISTQSITAFLDPGRAMGMAAQGLTSLTGLLTNTLLILLTVIFLLIESSDLPAKLHLILDNPEHSYRHFERFLTTIKHYMLIKTATSILTGVLVSTMLWTLGVDFPLLWGLVAFFLNYVPNIGSLIAAVPAILLALVQLGVASTLWVAMGYMVINNLVGNIVEPRFMGRELGLSPLVVFLSLVFWGWVLGTIGMFLSVPLTMTLKIALDSNDRARWISILLGPAPDPKKQQEESEPQAPL